MNRDYAYGLFTLATNNGLPCGDLFLVPFNILVQVHKCKYTRELL